MIRAQRIDLAEHVGWAFASLRSSIFAHVTMISIGSWVVSGCEDANAPLRGASGGQGMSGVETAGDFAGDFAGEITGGFAGSEAGALAGDEGELGGGLGGGLGGDISGTDDAGVEMSPFPPSPDGYPSFSFPIHPDDRGLMRPDPVFGYDHDPEEGARVRCLDYLGRGFPYCYDGHKGSDFILLGGFDQMDAGSARVISALAGEVIETDDGHYDRCHADLLSADVTCDGNPVRPNFVRVLHDNGWISAYYHFKRDSIRVRRGQRVECGEELGLVGSSGYSSAPHLHFEVEGPRGGSWDPFAGPESQPFSLWSSQPDPSEGGGSTAASSFPANACSPPSR